MKILFIFFVSGVIINIYIKDYNNRILFPPKNENNIKKKICPILPQFLKICKYYIQLLILISVETETLRIKNQEKTEHK